MLSVYFDMWKNIFNFKGYTSREDFRYFTIVSAVLDSILNILVSKCNIQIPLFIICIFIFLNAIVLTSLYVRRLRDCGRSWALLLLSITIIGSLVPFFICLFCESVDHGEYTKKVNRETENATDNHNEDKIKDTVNMLKNKKVVISIASVMSIVFILLGLGKANVLSGINIQMVKIPGMNIKMSNTEVTQKLYESVMGENPSFYQNGSEIMPDEFYEVTKGENVKKLPVECVSWYDAIYFCNKLSQKKGLTPVYSVDGTTDVSKWNYKPHNGDVIEGGIIQNVNANGYRLPTVEEWKYAAKGGQNYTYSGSDGLDKVGWYKENSNYKTHEVAKKKANGYGLYDMSGNVWEWCWDADPYDCIYRYSCGGSYFSRDDDCLVDSGDGGGARYQGDNRGFRIVCNAD